jgi:hypothetical protein
MEPWRVCRPVVADSHHFEEELDPDPQKSEKLDPDLLEWCGPATLLQSRWYLVPPVYSTYVTGTTVGATYHHSGVVLDTGECGEAYRAVLAGVQAVCPQAASLQLEVSGRKKSGNKHCRSSNVANFFAITAGEKLIEILNRTFSPLITDSFSDFLEKALDWAL